MADNIKIVGSILNTTQVSRYDDADLKLITTRKISKNFNVNADYIEYHVYDIGNNLLDVNYNYNHFKLPTDSGLNPGATPPLNVNNTSVTGAEVGTVSNLSFTGSSYPVIEIDPVQDLQDLGYTSGEFKVQYNVFKNKISQFPNAELFVKEISPDRTEIRVGSITLSNSEIESGSIALINTYNSSSIFDPFLLNFGNNIQEITTNISLNKVDTGYEILFKLYNALDDTINEKDSLWVVEEITTPYIFDINLDAILPIPTGKKLKGPRFKTRANSRLNTTSTEYKSFNELSSTDASLLNLNTSQSIDLNINYGGSGGDTGGFGEFVIFGSAVSRLQNFYTKVQQIEDYNNLIASYPTYITGSGVNTGSFSSSLQSEINTLSSKINDIISNFDGFESYLYFESGSLTASADFGVTPYPKLNSNKPYILYSTTSSISTSWYDYYSVIAEDYDLNNVNYFKYSVPGYVVDDPNNTNYLTFLNMMGQFFDNIWIYIKSVTEVNLANNNLETGISKDIVYNLLQSLGISVFNSFGNQNIAQYLVGANTGSAYYSGSLNNFSATSSYLNNVPKKDILAESYKRIYHNLPILLQRKGTVAGLRTLLSTFGISNQDYYTISGSTYYTPTGSAVTSSILSVKEYGGSTTSELLKEYNSDKVRIVNSIITGSVLSPLVSIQQYTSESSDFRTIDSHYVDISFSPQTLIDSFASSSIISSNPSWSLDDYIGDPRQLYSGSYNDLNAQKRIYFSPLSASIIPFTSTVGTGSIAATDYNNFIRLIQFFDNSLFKMLEDYIPARASLSTGVTISSPVLERNKVSYARTNNTAKEAVYEAEYSASRITPIYDPYYSKLSGNKVAYFDGAVSGSQLNIYNDYFAPGKDNPYTKNLNSYNVGKSIYQKLDSNSFLHSDFNVLLNNVSSSRPSLLRRRLETTGSVGYVSLGSGSTSILVSSSLQDSYLSLDSYTLPRYTGVRLSSTTYNTYTSGDVSYGKTAAIDHYVRKFGLFTQIVSSSFLPNRNTTALKYLVDESGSLTELNQTPNSDSENHWTEIQNTFKLGRNAVVSLFDNQKFSNQKNTDGTKPIFDSGYSYYPILYFNNSDTNLYFQYTNTSSTKLLMNYNNINGFITGSSLLRYTASADGYIYRIFDTANPSFRGNTFYSNVAKGNTNSFPTYSVPQNAYMSFGASFGININFDSVYQSVAYLFYIEYTGSYYPNGTLLAFQTQSFTSTPGITSNTILFNVTTSVTNLSVGDEIHFKLKQLGGTSGNMTSSLLATGPNTPYSGLTNTILTSNVAGFYPYAYKNNTVPSSPVGFYVSGSNGTDTFILNSSLTTFVDYQFLPSTGSINAYSSYGDVNYSFSPKVGDAILAYYSSGSQTQEFIINNLSYDSNNRLNIQVTPNLVSNLALRTYDNNTVNKFLLLSKVPDETNINLTFNKPNGQTSYGFIIPDNLSPDVLKNIDTITKEVQQKLLSTQATV